MSDDCAPLCINTSLRDAYKCLWHYKWNHLFIAYVAFLPFTILGLLGLLDPFFTPRSSTEIVPDGYNLSFLLFIASTYLWAIPSIILWHRLYLLGPEHLLRKKIWPILTRSFVLISKVLVLVGICVLVALILITLLVYIIDFMELNESINDFFALTDSEFTRYLIIMSLTAFITYLVFLRFTLAICARTIGKRIGLLTSWRLTEKSTLRMLLSFMVVFLPSVIIAYTVLYFYQSTFEIDLFFTGEMLSIPTYIHLFILAPVITLPLCATCSQCASFYRHCGGEDCMQDS